MTVTGDMRFSPWPAYDSEAVTSESVVADGLSGDCSFASCTRTDPASRNADHSSWTWRLNSLLFLDFQNASLNDLQKVLFSIFSELVRPLQRDSRKMIEYRM